MDKDMEKPVSPAESRGDPSFTSKSRGEESNKEKTEKQRDSVASQQNGAAETKATQKLDSSQVIRTNPDKKKKEGSLLEQLNSWILPIFSLVVLVIVGIFVLMPSANDTMDTLDEIRNIEQQTKRYESKIEQLEAIDIANVNSSLQIASEVIKDDLEVAELASDVEALAESRNLETKSVTFSSTSTTLINVPGFVGIISGPFTYEGNFDDIVDFISDLRTKSPTIVALREVSLSRSVVAGTEEESVWTANFVIDAFTTSKVENVSYQDTVLSDVDEELMDEIIDRINYSESLD